MPDHVVNVSVEPALTGRNRLTVAFRRDSGDPTSPARRHTRRAWFHDRVALVQPADRPVGRDDRSARRRRGSLRTHRVVCDRVRRRISRGPSQSRALLSALARPRRRVFRLAPRRVSAIRRRRVSGIAPVRVSLGARNRLSVAFRIILLIPQFIALWPVGVAWAITTLIAWVMVILTGDFPASLYNFGVGALRWSTRVEAYFLLLHDEYPPFSLR